MHPRSSEAFTNPRREFYFPSEHWFIETSLSPTTTRLHEAFHGERVSSYLVRSGNATALIDTGTGLSNIANAVPENTRVLLTHTHWDHMGNVSEFSDVSVFQEGLSRLVEGWRSDEIYGVVADLEPGVQLPHGFSVESFSIPGFTEPKTFADGQIIQLGNLHIRVITTPGHSPDSICFFIEETGELISGDTLYSGAMYLHMRGSNPEEYKQSLEKLKTSIGAEITAIYPGHNQPLPPEFLDAYLSAMTGDLAAVDIQDGENFWGQFTNWAFEDKGRQLHFSINLPRGLKLPLG